MKAKIFPRKTQPTQSVNHAEAEHAGRVVGVILSAILWACILLLLGSWALDLRTATDYVTVAIIGAVASLVFSSPYLQ